MWRRLLSARPAVRPVCRSRCFASIEDVTSRELRRGSIFLHKGIYCEVRSVMAGGQGTASSSGGYHVRFRELATRKAREIKMDDKARVSVVTCDREELPVLYRDDAAGKLVLADKSFNELEVPLAQLGDAAEHIVAGAKLAVLMYDGELVKIVPPPEVADALQKDHRKARKEELQARVTAKQQLREDTAAKPRRVGADPAAGRRREKAF
mmetsp:Transcript_3668/g.11134  ORF Transcript_3668/g.11134 Transcript_3668/m.11134 type:complete len:209 (+) Transcript_3668:57-683(+)